MEQSESKGATDSVLADLFSAAQLLRTDPSAAATRASEILDAVPGQQQALIVLVAALRLLGKDSAAREFLEWMAQERPRLASVQYELGLLLRRQRTSNGATENFSRVIDLEPNHAGALRALADQRAIEGDGAAAAVAYARCIKLSLRELKLLNEVTALGNSELSKAEAALCASLEVNPTDVMTRATLGKVYIRLERYREAREHLARALELAPDIHSVREDYAAALNYGREWGAANDQFDILAAAIPARRCYFRCQKASNLALLGDVGRALVEFEKIRDEEPVTASFWTHYGNALRTAVGRTAEAIVAYRQGLKAEPESGANWWALANLKTYRFSADEIRGIETQAARTDLSDEHRFPLEFALGKALEDEEQYAESFEHYRRGNALHRQSINYDAEEMTRVIDEHKAFFSSDFFASRTGFGCVSPDPIFIVGMPRSGSTLVEQILASHSFVEGTMELPDLPDAIAEFRMRHRDVPYPFLLSDLDHCRWKALGERYLELSRRQRKLDRPLFTDKAGNNFLHVGLIHVILPNAKIIDARRHPLGTCLSSYKQIFPAASLNQTYDLAEFGQYYRDYVRLMAHFDGVLPGRVHRVFYEDLVRDPETEIRRLLAYCGLQYEESCSRFYELDRAVRTISSEQVRRPIDESSGEQWRHFEPWLAEAKAALGDVLALYPQVPKTA